MSAKGRVDGRTAEIRPEALTVPLQPSARDRVMKIDLQCQFVALVRSVMLAQPLVENTHQTPGFGRFDIDVNRPAQVPLGVVELPAVQGLSRQDQFGGIAPRKCPSEKAVSDSIGAVSG